MRCRRQRGVLAGADAQEVGDGPEVLELVGVHYAAHGLDDTAEDFEGKNADNLSLTVVGNDAGPTVNQDRFECYPHSLCPFEQADDDRCDLVTPEERLGRTGRLAAPVAVEGGVRCQQVD